MRGPPDPEMRRAALAGSPAFQSSSLQHHQISEVASALQAKKFRRGAEFATDLARDLLRRNYASDRDIAASKAPGAIKRGPRLPTDIYVKGPPPTGGQIRVWRSDDCELPPNFRKKFHE
jgi:hypothetical protein